MYLMCVIPGAENTYHEVTEEQERKLSSLIKDKRLPRTFTLNSKDGSVEIVSNTILGFTEDRPEKKEKLDIKDWDEFRAWVKAQEWYKRQLKKA